jgi:Uma2 family endonuclease
VVAEVAPEWDPPTEGEPFTLYQLFDMPDNSVKYEVIDGEIVMSPSPSSDHQELGAELWLALRSAAPPDVRVFLGMTVRLRRDEDGPVPDITILRPGVKRRGRKFFEAEDVLALIEIVSPQNTRMDRILKPMMYAAVGIPYYWRVELSDFPGRKTDEQVPVVLVHELVSESYRAMERLSAGQKGRLTLPFPVEFDPADLLPGD